MKIYIQARHWILGFLFISGNALATPLDEAYSLLQKNVEDIPSTVSKSINKESWKKLEADGSDDASLMENDLRAFYCGGIAETFWRILQSHGIDAHIIDMAVGQATHVSVLVRFLGKHYVFYPTFRITLRDPNSFDHIAIEDALLMNEQAKRNLVFEEAMPLRVWLFESREQLEAVNRSFEAVKTKGSQVFYFLEESVYVKSYRPSFTLNTYLNSVAPFLRSHGMRPSYSSYVDFYRFSVRGPSVGGMSL